MAGLHALRAAQFGGRISQHGHVLGGMGPVNAPQTTDGKIFAGVFALYAGLIFIVSGAVLVTQLFIGCCTSFTGILNDQLMEPNHARATRW